MSSLSSLIVPLCVLVSSLLLPLIAGATVPPPLPEATLIRATGEAVSLSAIIPPTSSPRGKPLVLFYESPDSERMNQKARDELRLHALSEVIDVVAVANLEGLDWWPARPIALSAARSEEDRADLTVLIDLTGVLRKAPWLLDPKTSTVLVISAQGEPLFRAEGKLQGQRLDELKATLARLR